MSAFILSLQFLPLSFKIIPNVFGHNEMWDFKNSQQQCQTDNAGVSFVCRLSILPRNILLPPPPVVFVLSSVRVSVTVLHYLTQVVPGLNIQYCIEPFC
jgi:hypothetical protein